MKKVFLILLITFSFADLKIKTENNELIKEVNDDVDQIFHLAAVNGTQNFYDNPELVLTTNTLSTSWSLSYLLTTEL